MKFPFYRFWWSAAALLMGGFVCTLEAGDPPTSGGVLILTGSNPYPDNTTTIGGALITTGAGTLTFGSGSVLTNYGTISLGGPVATLTLDTALTPTTILTTGGSLTIGGYIATQSGNVLFTTSGAVVLNSSSVLSVTPGGTLNWSGSNVGSGTLSLTAGSIPRLTVGSLNTLNVTVAAGSTLNSIPNVLNSVTGVGARILQGTLTVDNSVSFLYLPAIANLAGAPLDLHFANGASDKFVLQMSYNPAAAAALGDEENLYLGWFDSVAQVWKKAIDANSDGGTHARFVQGAYNSATDFNLGTYGVDTVNHTVWAVIDHNSTFGVANSELAPAVPTPEPSAAILTLLSGCGLLLARRRNRR